MAQPTPILSIIVVSFNTKEITDRCLRSIQKSLINSKIPHEIIVADNNSSDGSREMLAANQKIIKELKIIKNSSNLGFGKANNQAVHESRGKYLFFLNSDIVVLENAVSTLLEFFKKNENRVQFVGGKLLNKDLSPQPSCGPFYSPAVVFGALFLKGDYWGLTRSSPSQEKKVDWISGACILTRKDYFEKINGFDESIFMYMEEIDLLYRAKKAGFTTYYYPKAKFVHLGFASSGSKTYPILQVYRGFLFFYKKHYSPLNLALLKIMLQLKAGLAIFTGKLTGNMYLVETYEKAQEILSVA